MGAAYPSPGKLGVKAEAAVGPERMPGGGPEHALHGRMTGNKYANLDFLTSVAII